MEGLEFEVRKKPDRYQVRFWSTPNIYGSFVSACEREGLLMQDVFNDFMIWFEEASMNKKLPVKRNSEAP